MNVLYPCTVGKRIPDRTTAMSSRNQEEHFPSSHLSNQKEGAAPSPTWTSIAAKNKALSLVCSEDQPSILADQTTDATPSIGAEPYQSDANR